MLKAKATKPKTKPPIEISDDKFLSTSSTSSSLSSPYLSRIDKEVEEVDKLSPAYIRNQRKRSYPLLSPEKEVTLYCLPKKKLPSIVSRKRQLKSKKKPSKNEVL